MIKTTCNKHLLLLFILAWGYSPLFGQTDQSDSIPVRYLGSLDGTEEESYEGPRWIALPVLWYTPETRLAFGGSGLYYFDADPGRENTTVSSLQALFLYSLNKQLISELNGTIFRSDDELQLRFTAGYYRYPNFFFGIGNNTLEENEETYTNAYPYLRLRMKQEVIENVFLGVAGVFEYNRFINLEDTGLLIGGEVPGVEGGINWGLGFSTTYDSRDNPYFSYRGTYAEFTFTNHSTRLGSDFEYLDITADIRQFFRLPVNRTHIVALQLYGQFQTGQAPFHRLSLMGGPEQMRGYFRGRYRDRQYLAFQTEYRFPIWRFIRGSAFGTAGQVAPTMQDFRLDEMKYSVGAGLRILLVPDDRIYMRFDYGYAFDGRGGFYFQFNEAF